MMIRSKKEYQVGDEIKIDGLVYVVEKVEEKKSHFLVTTSDIGELGDPIRTVEVNGKTFKASDESLDRIHMAITTSSIAGVTEHEWKLDSSTAGDRVQLVTVDELKTALLLGMQKVAEEVL